MALKEHSPSSKSRKQTYLLTTAAIYLGNIVIGSTIGGYAVTMLYFLKKFNQTEEVMTLIMSVSLLSYLVGAVSVSFLYRFIRRQLGIIIFLSGMTFCLAISPHCPTMWSLYLGTVLSGVCMGGYEGSQIIWVIEMWQTKAGPYVQAQLLATGIGSLIPGLLMAPFLKTTEEEGIDVMWIPFTILAAIGLLATSFQLCLYIFRPYYPPPREVSPLVKTEIEMKNVSSSVTPDVIWPKYLKLKFVSLCVFFFAIALAMDIAALQFLPMFASYGVFALSESEAAQLSFIAALSSCAGRGIGILAIMKIPPQLLLVCNYVIVIIANVLLMITSQGVWTLWVGASLLGLGLSTMLANFNLFIMRHLVMSNEIGSALVTGGSLMGAIYPIIIGQFIKEDPFILNYLSYFSLGVTAIAFVLIYWLASTKAPGKM